jgi:hypothetical protein
MNPLAALGLSLTLAGCGATGQATTLVPPAMRPTPLADVQIVDRTTGAQLPIYWSNGQRWVAGVPGHKYAVRVHSRSGARILTVLSVDGINAVSGETAGWDQTGYVLGPWQSTDVLGWRKSQDRVADFIFGSLDDSYAARTGRADNVGVIGVASFREAAPPPPPVSLYEPRREDRAEAKSAAPAAPGAAAPAESGAAQDALASRVRPALGAPGPLATGHGPSESSYVSSTDFERAQASPDGVLTIRYDRRERLVAMGIIPEDRAPQPFPESAQSGFVADPPPRPW